MYRYIAMSGLIATLALAGCGPVAPAAAVLPTFIPSGATAEINSAYPTQQAAQQNTSQSVGGFSVDLQRAWRDGKQVDADICFTLPDQSDWTVWNAQLAYGGQTNTQFSSSMLSRQDPQGGQPGQRCDQLGFYVPPDADLSSSSLTIESLGAYPSQEDYCTVYMPKIQQALNERGTGITLDCTNKNGSVAMEITGKPASMSQDEAEQLVYSDEFYTVKGPWTFPLTFNP
ncbi:MAG TPA: hypothetical protein VF784_04570 [Anaerolineales bacterium]